MNRIYYYGARVSITFQCVAFDRNTGTESVFTLSATGRYQYLQLMSDPMDVRFHPVGNLNPHNKADAVTLTAPAYGSISGTTAWDSDRHAYLAHGTQQGVGIGSKNLGEIERVCRTIGGQQGHGSDIPHIADRLRNALIFGSTVRRSPVVIDNASSV